jgi:7-cyano-7-deazaguanine reductase
MDTILRRERLETRENRNNKIDYLVTLQVTISKSFGVVIRYIPDLAILDTAAVNNYFATLGAINWENLEELGLTILNDLNNELVPRWVQVTVSGTSAGIAHCVTLEDRQPRWDNPALLSRITSL